MGCSPCLLSDGVGKGSWVLFLRVPSCHVPLQPNFPSVLGPGLSRSSSGHSSSLAQSLLEGGDAGCRGLCHNEMKGLGRMSLLGSQKEPFPSSSRPKAPAVPKEKHLLAQYTFHPDVWVPCRSAGVGLPNTVSGNRVFFLELEGREGGRD